MIVLVGTRFFNQKNGSVADSECPVCQTISEFRYSVYKKYTHLTFIPIFPVNSVIEAECCHCKKIFEYDELPDSIRKKMLEQEKNSQFKTPIWMFSGTFILIGVLAYATYSYFQNNGLTATYISNPVAGDVYSLKFSDGYYSTMRIDSVSNDSVYAIDNNFDAYLSYQTDEIDLAENYTDKLVKFSKKDLIRQFDNGTVYLIKRK